MEEAQDYSMSLNDKEKVLGIVHCGPLEGLIGRTDTRSVGWNILVLSKETHAWEKRRNAQEKNVDWQFTPGDARIRLKRLYPLIQTRSSISFSVSMA